MKKPFLQEITEVLNRHSRENESNTPDFILSGFINDVLEALEAAIRKRENWYGREMPNEQEAQECDASKAET